MGELLPGLWGAEVDLLISLCANYPSLSWKKMKINVWYYVFKQKISRVVMQLTVNYPTHSLLWIIWYSQISIPKFCLNNHSSNNKTLYTYEKQKNPTPQLPSVKTNISKSSYLYSDGKAMILLAKHKSQRNQIIWHEAKMLNCKRTGFSNDYIISQINFTQKRNVNRISFENSL